MTKLYKIGLVCSLSLVCFAATAASALAVDEWLLTGNPVTVATAVRSSGELELRDTAGITTSVLCSLTLVGTVSAAGADEVTEVLNLAGEKIGSKLEGLALLCTAVETCETGNPADIEVWIENLPWKTQISLMMLAPEFLDVYGAAGKEPGYTVLCLIEGINVVDLCEGKTSNELKNVAGGGVEGIFNPSSPISSEEQDCNEEKAISGEIKGTLVTNPTGGGMLATS